MRQVRRAVGPVWRLAAASTASSPPHDSPPTKPNGGGERASEQEEGEMERREPEDPALQCEGAHAHNRQQVLRGRLDVSLATSAGSAALGRSKIVV